MDRHKVGRHNSEVVIVDTEDPCCIHRGVDHTKNIFPALLIVSTDLSAAALK